MLRFEQNELCLIVIQLKHIVIHPYFDLRYTLLDLYQTICQQNILFFNSTKVECHQHINGAIVQNGKWCPVRVSIQTVHFTNSAKSAREQNPGEHQKLVHVPSIE